MIKLAAPLLLLLLGLAACNTAQGFGRDVSATGSAITGTAEDTEDDLTD